MKTNLTPWKINMAFAVCLREGSRENDKPEPSGDVFVLHPGKINLEQKKMEVWQIIFLWKWVNIAGVVTISETCFAFFGWSFGFEMV